MEEATKEVEEELSPPPEKAEEGATEVQAEPELLAEQPVIDAKQEPMVKQAEADEEMKDVSANQASFQSVLHQ